MTLTRVGLLLDILGVGIAIWGVERLAEDLRGEPPHLSITRATRGIRSALRRLRRRRSQSAQVSAMAAGVVVATGDFQARATPGLPEEQADLGAVLDYVGRIYEALTREIDIERAERKAEDRRVADVAVEADDRLRQELQGEIHQLRDHLAGGPRGEGLQIAAVGLFLTAVGGVLQLLGSWLNA